MAGTNPFTPTFGVTPPLMVGRSEILDEFSESLVEGVGSPHRALAVTGARGSGKTVVLNALEDVARRRGWIVASTTASRRLATELTTEVIPTALRERFGEMNRSTMTGAQLTVLGIGVNGQRQVQEEYPITLGLRSIVTQAADMMSVNGGGLLITVDEVHRSAEADIVEVSQVVQHCFREGRDVALVVAGLPTAVNEAVLDNPVTTFMRRAEKYHLGSVSDSQVAEAIRTPIENQGWSITDEALDIAVTATGGYPFLIQLVGRQVWRAARGLDRIDVEAARQGTERAVRRVGELVHVPALDGISDTDRSFLTAMSVDDGPSKMGDIADRLHVNAQYVGVYRRRCIDHGLVISTGHGWVDFALPYLRDFLKSHAAAYALEDRG